MIENKETITFDEFRAWLTGLIVGKGGAIPDLDDWKMIKKMLDKVEPEKETLYVPSQPYDPAPFNPYPYGPSDYPPSISPYVWPTTSDRTYTNDGNSLSSGSIKVTSDTTRLQNGLDDSGLQLSFTHQNMGANFDTEHNANTYKQNLGRAIEMMINQQDS